jgi:hypothetical protein
VVLPPGTVSIEPPVPVEVEVPGEPTDVALVAELEAAIRARLTFRTRVELVTEAAFGESAWKTRLTVTRR